MDLQHRLGLAYLFIAHDLSVVRHISNRIAVMYLGRIVEIGDAAHVYAAPKHPYTEALLSAIPMPEPERAADPPAHRAPGRRSEPARRRRRAAGSAPAARTRWRCARKQDPGPFTAADGTTVFCHLHTDGPRLDGRPVTELEPAVD